MRPQRWDANCRAAAGDVARSEDLLRLPNDLHLLLRVAILLERINVRDHVEGQWVREHLVHHLFARHLLLDSLHELGHPFGTSSTSGLICRDNGLPEGELFVDRPERHRGDGCRAVGVGNQQLSLHHLCVHLRNDERNVVLIAEGTRVVNHYCLAVGDDLRGVLCGEASGDRHEREVALLHGLDREELDLHLTVGCRQLLASGTLRCKEAQLLQGKASVMQHFHHLLPDSAGGAHDTHHERACLPFHPDVRSR
mmetsp:Transcript_87025/g.224050  ORF Transcript_87025/g.224050 Transcript_87025/m.224050 type:complete len:253 (-) Transcript_87025:45-803(-)